MCKSGARSACSKRVENGEDDTAESGAGARSLALIDLTGKQIDGRVRLRGRVGGRFYANGGEGGGETRRKKEIRNENTIG